MQPGNLTGDSLQAFESRVLVNGRKRQHNSWNVDRELSGDLPDQVVAGSGIRQATGSVSFAGVEVESVARNPWNSATGWLPKPGARVEIWVSDGTTEWMQFTGRIDKTTGTIAAGFESTIIDDYDDTSALVSHEPLLRTMPPSIPGGGRRTVGLFPQYHVDYALRASGFYTTPPDEHACVFSVPGQGTIWPHRGEMVESNAVGGEDNVRSFSAPWGLVPSFYDAMYTPQGTPTASEPTQLTACVAPDHASNFFLTCSYTGGAEKTIELSVNVGRVAVARIAGEEVCRAALGTATIVTLLFKGGRATLRTDKGLEVSGSKGLNAGAMTGVRIRGYGETRVGGIQVSLPSTQDREFRSTRFAPSAIIDTSSFGIVGSIEATPTITSRPASELLAEISDSVLAGMWIDEKGIFWWSPSTALAQRKVVRTVSTMDDILDLQWEDSFLGSRSRVTVKGQRPAISRSRWPSIVVYEGSGGEMRSEEVSDVTIEPDADEDWIMPNTAIIQIGAGNWWRYNDQTNSVAGGYYSSGGSTVSDEGLSMDIDVKRLGINRLKITHTAGAYPTDVVANLEASPNDSDLWPKNKGKPLPRHSAYGKVVWSDTEAKPITAGGVGPELVHDTGFWANRVDSGTSNGDLLLENMAVYLSGQTATPKPVITGLDIIYDPRLQLGDVVNIKSERLMGVQLRALIVGVGNSAGPDFTQTLSVRIIGAASTLNTYQEYNNSLMAADLTWNQWDALGPKPETFTQFNLAE